MLNVALVVAVTVLAQAGPTDPFFGEKEEAIVYTYRAEVERSGQISKDLRQNATPPVSSPGAADVPVVAVSALLSLADWLRQRTRSTRGDHPCATAFDESVPPRAA